VGYHINELNLEQEFDLKIIALIRGNQVQNCLGVSVLERGVANEFPEDYELTEADGLVCYGLYTKFIQFWKSIR
jgi:trk system potassium uptake protein TrkA